jgi:hypothetical protein
MLVTLGLYRFLTASRETPSMSTTLLMILLDAPRILRTSALILPSSLYCESLAKNPQSQHTHVHACMHTYIRTDAHMRALSKMTFDTLLLVGEG